MSSREFGASRPRRTQKIGVNPGAFFRYPKTHTGMLLNPQGLVKRLNTERTRFFTSRRVRTRNLYWQPMFYLNLINLITGGDL